MENILAKIALIAPVLLFSVIAHEIAHGYAALRQGDPTAYQLGRLSWNPVRHIDPYFTVLLPLVMIALPGSGVLAGAKPVPVNPRNYRDLVRGDIVVSLAGVTTNLAIAVLFTIVMIFAGLLGRFAPVLAPGLGMLQGMLAFGIFLNCILVLFNLLPIPPLDGSHVMKYLLPPGWALAYVRAAPLGFAVLILVVLAAPGALRIMLAPAVHAWRFAIGLVMASNSLLSEAAPWLQILFG